MKKFQVLEYNQYYMSLIGVDYCRSNYLIKLFKNVYILMGTFAVATISSAAFIFYHRSNIEALLQAIVPFIAGLQVTGCYLNIRLKVKKIDLLNRSLQEIVNEAEAGAYEIYWKTEQICRKYTETMFFYPYVHETMFLPSLITAIYDIYRGEYSIETWQFAFSLEAPFDTTVLWGWFLEWFLQCMFMGIGYSFGLLTALTYFMSGCLYVMAICEHFKWQMDSVNDDVNRYQKEINVLESRKIQHQIHLNLIKAVKIHIKTLGIAAMVADINSGSIFSMLPLNAVFLGILMYNIEHTHFSFFTIALTTCSVACALVWVYIYCYFADVCTSQISRIGDIVYDSKWMDFPSKQKKCMQMVIKKSKSPTRFKGLSIVGCTVEIFGKLVRSSFSYYMVFRSFTSI